MTFREFVNLVNPRYKWFKHCEVLGQVLQDVAEGKRKRVMVFMPPRHGKSEEVTRLFTAYYLYRFPEKWVGLTCFGQDLANTHARAARDNYKSSGGPIKADADSVKHWETGKGGGMWAAGVGGPITGKGFHLGIIDDPVKNSEDAASEQIRKTQKEWYNSTFYTREEPNEVGDPDGAIIVIQTRWHEDDLAGWLLAEEKEILEEGEEEPERWHIVCFEAIKEAAEQTFPASCTIEPDWRCEGEALCPERRPVEKLKRIWRRIKDYFWYALFQQRPVPAGGSFFQKDWFEIHDHLPSKLLNFIRYWDLAGAEEGKGDWTIGVLMAQEPSRDRNTPGDFWIVDVVRFQKASNERDDEVVATAEADRKTHGRVQIYIERPPGLGKEPVEALIRKLAGYSAYEDGVTKDKQSRWEPVKSQARAGNVKMLKNAKWNGSFLSVLQMVPYGKHDDDADALAGAFNKSAGPSGGFSQSYVK